MNDSDEKDWDAYLENAPGKLPTLLSAWKHILEKTYGQECFFLIARHESTIHGVLPLYEVKSKIFGHRLETPPGAMCADSPEAATALITEADRLAQELDADNLILRDSREDWTSVVPDLGLTKLELHRGVVHHIMSDEQSAWEHFSSSFRKGIRIRQSDEKLHISIGSSGHEDFHKTILKFTHRVATPCFSSRFVQNVIDHLPEHYQIVNVSYDGDVVASYFNLVLGKTIFGIWGAPLPERQRLNATNKSIWASVKWGIEHGYKSFDLGRSGYPSPQFSYKSRVADVDYPIYQILRVYRGEAPGYLRAHQTEKDSGPVALMRNMWPYLPLPLVGFAGPKIRKHIPFG